MFCRDCCSGTRRGQVLKKFCRSAWGRVEVWRGGVGRAYRLAAPFGWRCLTGPTVLRFQTPLIEPDGRISRIRLSEKASRRRPREVTRPPLEADQPPPFALAWSAACSLWTLSGVARLIANLPSFAASCARLQPRPLPSAVVSGFVGTTGLSVARRGPEASLAGLRSAVTRGRRCGFPVFTPVPSSRHAAATTPAGPRGPSRSPPRAASAFPVAQTGRLLR